MSKHYDPAAEGRAAVREDDNKRMTETKLMGLIKAMVSLSNAYLDENEDRVAEAMQDYMEAVNPEFDFVALASLVTDGLPYEAETVEFVDKQTN